MSTAPIKVNIGDELLDGFKPTDVWIKNGIQWLDDITGFYRERSAIEKEYSAKLSALSSKYFDKKAKLSTNLSVGDTPQITPGSLENASLVAWTEILSRTEQLAKDRARLGNEFGLQIADQISGAQSRFENLRRTYETYQDKLEEDRDHIYSELKKSKLNYDGACQSMENQRAKASKSSSDRTNRKAEDKEREMNNIKNNYLIKINVANRIKDKYYHEDIPELLDTMQLINESRVSLLNNFWKQSVELEKSCLSKAEGHLTGMTSIVDQNSPGLDSAMFVKHNIKQWTEPKDFVYEPSPIWHEDELMVTKDQSSLQYLKERMSEATKKLTNYQSISSNKLEEYKTVLNSESNVDRTKVATLVQYLAKRLSILQGLTVNESLRLIYDVELETVQIAVNGKDLGSVPDAPSKKRRGLFGLGGGQSKNTTKSNDITPVQSNASTGQSSSSTGQVHHHGGFVSSLLGRSRLSSGNTSKTSNSDARTAKALYDYTSTGPDEASIKAGEELTIIEADDGSGWTEVKVSSGSLGLVPTSYLEITANNTNGKKKGPTVAPKRGAKKVSYVVAQYDYEAQDGDELSIKAGDKILVITEDSGDGWTEGEIAGKRGLFPSSYVQSL